MSSSPGVRGILLTHGAMADGIVDAVRRITGADESALEPLSNRGVSPDVLAGEIRARLGGTPTVVFTDLQSGSCGLAALRVSRETEGLVVISGVNLPMLLEFVMNRHLPVEELVPRLLEKGRAAIGCAPGDLADSDADRSAPD